MDVRCAVSVVLVVVSDGTQTGQRVKFAPVFCANAIAFDSFLFLFSNRLVFRTDANTHYNVDNRTMFSFPRFPGCECFVLSSITHFYVLHLSSFKYYLAKLLLQSHFVSCTQHRILSTLSIRMFALAIHL